MQLRTASLIGTLCLRVRAKPRLESHPFLSLQRHVRRPTLPAHGLKRPIMTQSHKEEEDIHDGLTISDEEVSVEEMSFHDNGLRLELAPFGLEKIYDYEPGGHHPVHLGDLLGQASQYKVLHKLGNGGSANVWLCLDTGCSSPTYVAAKILVAVSSTSDCPELLVNTLHTHNDNDEVISGGEHVALPLDQFDIDGPNGHHLCFVYSVFGPRASLGYHHKSAKADEILRTASEQTVEALRFLHTQGLCHGDFTPANVLHKVIGLDGLQESEVMTIFGTPVENAIVTNTGEPHENPEAPSYMVYPVDWTNVATNYISTEIVVIDLGQAFEISQPPEDIGIPGPYRSPELLLDHAVGRSCDIWALGCTLFTIRTGRVLFNNFVDEDDEYLENMVELFGKMPEPWWSTSWALRREVFEDEVDDLGRAISLRRQGEPAVKRTVHPSVAHGARSLRDMMAPGVWYMEDGSPRDVVNREISDAEKDVFADLLGHILMLDPAGRWDTEKILEHEWFSYK